MNALAPVTKFEYYGHKVTRSILDTYRDNKVFCGGEEHGYAEFIKFCNQRFEQWCKINVEADLVMLMPKTLAFAQKYFFHDPKAMGLTECSIFVAHNVFSFRDVFSTDVARATPAIQQLWNEYSNAVSTAADLDNDLAWDLTPSDNSIQLTRQVACSAMDYRLGMFSAYSIVNGTPAKRESKKSARDHVLTTLGYGKVLRTLNCGFLSIKE